MTTEQRLERMERENRWMRRIGAVSIAVVVAVFLVGQAKDKEPPDLVVRSLTMKDKDGRTRAQLWMFLDKVHLDLCDVRGRARATLSLMKDGSPSLRFCDSNRKARLRIGAERRVGPFLDLSDKDGKTRATLGLTAFALRDANRKVIWKAPGE
ncbi:MAG: hypothetical protein ACYS0K_24425 [Planctomycetota bacterium]|jgi:hypothetical protein